MAPNPTLPHIIRCRERRNRAEEDGLTQRSQRDADNREIPVAIALCGVCPLPSPSDPYHLNMDMMPEEIEPGRECIAQHKKFIGIPSLVGS